MILFRVAKTPGIALNFYVRNILHEKYLVNHRKNLQRCQWQNLGDFETLRDRILCRK